MSELIQWPPGDGDLSAAKRALLEQRMRRAAGRGAATTGAPVLVVGYTPPMQKSLDAFQPPGSVIYVDEPDVAIAHQAAAAVRSSSSARQLVTFEYQLPGATDAFFENHRDLRPSAVIPGMEYAVPFAATLAERYGLPGAGVEAGRTLRDKYALRTVTRAAGIANPCSQRVDSPDAVRAFMAEQGGPIVLKPANRQGSIGVQILVDPAQIDRAWAACTAADDGPFVPARGLPLRMLAEQYVAGDEFSVELVVRNGESVFANVTAKILFPGPRPVERGHVVPADLPPEQTELLIRQTRRVVEAVGFANGFIHCEWIVSGETPYLVECAGRMPGDGIVELLSLAWQTDIVRTYLAVMQGFRIAEKQPTHTPRGAAVWFLHAAPGRVLSVDGVDDAQALPDVRTIAVSVAPGDHVHGLRSSVDRVALATACSTTSADALRRAQDAIAAITVRTVPAQPTADGAGSPETSAAADRG